MMLTLDVLSREALADLRLELAPGDEGQGEVAVRLLVGPGQFALVRLGRDFELDGELAERLGAVEGIANVQLQPIRGRANLRLVA
jgi:DNA polymerase-3 subunit alpha